VASSLINRVAVDRGQPHSASLVEAKSVKVVVAGDQPETMGSVSTRFLSDRGQQAGSDSGALLCGVECYQLTLAVREVKGCQPNENLTTNCQFCRQSGGVGRATPADYRRRPPVRE
jgi:hypothetical protein